MNISIENLKTKMIGRKLNIHQEADALIEFNKLIEYVEELELDQILNESYKLVSYD